MKKRILSWLMVISMCLGLFPGTAFATEEMDGMNGNTSAYDVWVGGVQVTSENMNNVLNGDTANDGKVSYAPANGEAPARLTITGAKIIGAVVDIGQSITGNSYGIYADGDLEIVVTTNSTADGADVTANSASSYGVYVRGKLTLSGDGTLTATGGSVGTDGFSAGVFCGGTLTNNGKLHASGQNYGVYCASNLIVSGGTLTATGGETGVSCTFESITINGGALNATGTKYYGVDCALDFTINGGTLTATGGTKALNQNLPTAGSSVTLIIAAGDDSTGTDTSYINQKYVHITTTTGGESDTTEYDVWVGGVQVTSANAADVLGEADGSDTTVIYTPANGENPARLTLNGAAIGGAVMSDHMTTSYNGYGYGIWSDGDLEIVVTTNSTANGADVTANSASSYGVYVNGKLTLSGGGTLTATGGRVGTDGDSCGVYCSDTLTSIGTLNVSGGNYGVVCGSTLNIRGGTLTAISDKTGVSCGTASITISGGALDATGIQYYGVDCGSTFTISGGTLTVTGGLKALNQEIPTAGSSVKLIIAAGESSGSATDTTYTGQKYVYITTTVATDTTAPTLSAGDVNRTSDTGATVKFTSSEAGQYYYAVVDERADTPTIDTTAAGTACDTAEQTITLTGLTAGAKDIYIVVKDVAGNESDALKITIPAYVHKYNVWVDGVQVTLANMNDVLDGDTTNDGKVSYTPASASVPAKLTLNGATITGVVDTDDSNTINNNYGYGIWAEGDLEIVVTADSSVAGANATQNYGAFSYGIFVKGNLACSGAGTLMVSSGKASISSTGVYCLGNLTTNGTLITSSDEATTYSYSVRCVTSLTNNGTLTATGGTVTGVSGDSYGVATNGNLTNNGTLTATGGAVTGTNGDSYGVFTYENLITNGTFTATGGKADTSSYGVSCNKLSLNGGTLTAIGDQRALTKTPTVGTDVKLTVEASANIDGTGATKVDLDALPGSYKYVKVTTGGESDTTKPTLTAGDVNRTSDTEATVKFTSDKSGHYYYAVVESGAKTPIIITTAAGTACDTTEQTITLDNLAAGEKDIYIVVKDAAENVSDALKITIPEYVSATTEYSVWVGGVHVTSDNAADVLGEADGAGATVIYTPANGENPARLTLTGAAIGNAVMSGHMTANHNGCGYGIWSDDDLEIELTGTNTATGADIAPDSSCSFGVRCGGSLTVSGEGTLTATSGTSTVSSFGVYCVGNLTNNGTLTAIGCTTLNTAESIVVSQSEGVYCGGNLTNNGTLTASANISAGSSFGVWCENDFTINSGACLISTGMSLWNKKPTAGINVKLTVEAGANIDGTGATNVSLDTLSGSYRYVKVTTGGTGDTTAPTLSSGDVNRTSDTEATVKFTSSEAGQYYYAVVDEGADTPTIDTTAAGTACDTAEQTITLTGLTAGAKDIYIVVKDAAENVSNDTFKINIPAYESVPVSTTVTPAAASYDKYMATGGLTFTLTPGAHTLTAIKNGMETLTDGTDYTVSGNRYTITERYLGTQPEGSLILVFDMDSGTDPMVSIAITDSAPDSSHTHSGNLVSEKDADCTAPGNKAYYSCSCGLWFEDAVCLIQIENKDSWIIPAAGHDFITEHNTAEHWKKCQVCGYIEGKENHTYGNDSVCDICGCRKLASGVSSGGSSGSSSGGSSHDGLGSNGSSTAAYSYITTAQPYVYTGIWKAGTGPSVIWQLEKEDHTMARSQWAYLENQWYIFDSYGNMMTGWANVNGIWYYFGATGAMMTGWVNVNGIWYYLDETGAMYAGRWVAYHDKWYYLDRDGRMLVNRKSPDGYQIGADGTWIQ